MPPRIRHAALLLVAGLGSLLAATQFPSHSAPRADAPLQVAQLLDSVVQPRFQEEVPKFGISRIPPFPGHENVPAWNRLRPDEAEKIKRAQAANHAFVVAFLHCAAVPAKPNRRSIPSPPPGHPNLRSVNLFLPPAVAAKYRRENKSVAMIATPVWDKDTYEAYGKKNLAVVVPSFAAWEGWNKTAQTALPRLMQGQKIDATSGNWLLALRPVRASQTSCLKCHEGAKIGDTLGVMVYAIHRNPNDLL